ncbi:MAG TPA: hypothetical protein VMZ90_08435, partial [Vicinamibacterales bacterium]|nr:hypothetical protein [Vicinamibacterales bacterium]
MMKSVFARFIREEQGQDLIEYAFLAVFIGLAVTLGTIALPAGHTPGLLRAVRCPGGDPGCGLAVVDPDGAAISLAIVEGPCRL